MNNTETKVCRRCQQGYEPQYWNVLNTQLLRGDGYCPSCAKQVYDEEVAKEEATRQAEIAKVRRQRRESSGIPPKFMSSDFSTFEKGWQDKALKFCKTYAEAFPIDRYPRGYQSLYLWASGVPINPGGNGTGKSHLSAAICHRILDRWTGNEKKGCPRIIFLSEPELFDQIQATYSFSQQEKQLRESESDIIKRIVGADLVVLDDVGKEVRQKSDFVHKTLFKIINGRYDERLPMIITANLDPAGLHQHLDELPAEASFGRFYDEMSRGNHYRMDGKSYRREKH